MIGRPIVCNENVRFLNVKVLFSEYTSTVEDPSNSGVHTSTSSSLFSTTAHEVKEQTVVALSDGIPMQND